MLVVAASRRTMLVTLRRWETPWLLHELLHLRYARQAAHDGEDGSPPLIGVVKAGSRFPRSASERSG